jgi:LuxR family maltose regulon positive regulatory protein
MAHERPDRLPELHQAAASWLEQQGLVDDAIRHGLAAGDSLWAARLVERHIDARMLRSEGVTVRRWHQALPIELFSPRPRLCLAQAFVAAAATDVEAIEPSLDAAERALGGAAYEAFEPSVGRAASLLANVPAAIALERATLAHLRGDAEQTSVFARRAHAELRDGEWVLESVIGWYLAVADWWSVRSG